MVKTSPSNAGGVGSTLDQGATISHVHGQNPKMENSRNTVTNSIKTLKMVHIKKNFKKLILRMEAESLRGRRET